MTKVEAINKIAIESVLTIVQAKSIIDDQNIPNDRFMENIQFDVYAKQESFFLNDFLNKVYRELNNNLEVLIIEGLKRKGFEFKNRIELINFIKLNIRCEDRTDLKQKIYLVNDIPFFLHNYEMVNEFSFKNEKREYIINVNYGSYTFL